VKGSTISTAALQASLPFHVPPIQLVVFQRSYTLSGRGSHLEVGFPLRCFQRFSVPEIATRHCTWRHNRHTSAPSSSVLSY